MPLPINQISLDLGSSKIAAIIANLEKGRKQQISGKLLSSSEGVKSGLIYDMQKAEKSISNCIYSIEQKFDCHVRQAAISLSGAHTKSFYIYHTTKISSKNVSKSVIRELIYRALSDFKIEDYEIIHYFPVEYIINNNYEVQNPLDMIAEELSVRLHIVAAKSSILDNLTKCMAKCHLEVSDIFLSIYASGMACLTDDELNLGALVLDIGSKTTSFGVFYKENLLYTGHIPVGGWHITSDIAKALSINFNLAEKLKVLYGTAIGITQHRNKVIDLSNIEKGNESGSVTTSLLSQIIIARVEEILELTKIEFDQMNIDHLIASSVVITGGSVMLRGVKEMASDIFDKNIRIAKPQNVDDFDSYNPYIFSTAYGMTKIKSMELNNKFKDDNNNGKFIVKITQWIKDNIL